MFVSSIDIFDGGWIESEFVWCKTDTEIQWERQRRTETRYYVYVCV